ncbi:MAG TPA: C39 family peptidase [Vicinamibacterales bacterium]
MTIRSVAKFSLLLLFLTTSAYASDLDIDPIFQETPVWCWTTVGEMVFRYFGVANINPAGNFQCGIIALLNPVCNQNCFNCQVGAGSLETMNNMLNQYPSFASRVTHTSTRLRTQVRRSRLTLAQIQTEIDSGRPVVVGISPSGRNTTGTSEHVALIVGYDDTDIVVNDPFPFGSQFFPGDPYKSAGAEQIIRGQYKIDYSTFATRMQWRETIYRIQCSGSDCTNEGGGNGSDRGLSDDHEPRRNDSPPAVEYGRSCATPVTRCGPFYNQQPLPLGSECWCATPYGPSAGRVVRP